MPIIKFLKQSEKSVASDLRTRIVKGGAAIAVRQGIGMVLSASNLILVTRIIGPAQYGLFAGSYGIVSMISIAGTWGLDVYLLRKESEPTDTEYNQAFTFFLGTGLLFSILLMICRHPIARMTGIHALALPLAVMSVYILFNLANVPGIVRLDRELRFKRVGVIELVGQAGGYCVAIPLAFLHMGCWAPILGAITGQILMTILIYVSAPMRLRLQFNRSLSWQMLSYGLSYSGAIWIWQLRTLVNPLVVGRFAGATGVGYVALAIRLVEVLAFIKQATWRVAMAALAKLGDNQEKLRRSITEGMCLQAFMVGVPLTVFALIAPFILPHIFGQRWDPTFRLFPLIALSYLMNAMFNLHTSVLALIKHNLEIGYFHVTHVILFAGSAVILVSRFGYIGYGWAEVVAFTSYYLLHYFLSRQVGSPDYSRAILWLLVCGGCIVLNAMPGMMRLFSLVLLPLPFIFARERESLGGYARLLLRRSPA
jgi:PST family polysaccharide transporter